MELLSWLYLLSWLCLLSSFIEGYDHTIKFWAAHSGVCTRTHQHPESQVLNTKLVCLESRYIRCLYVCLSVCLYPNGCNDWAQIFCLTSYDPGEGLPELQKVAWKKFCVRNIWKSTKKAQIRQSSIYVFFEDRMLKCWATIKS